jgi:multicomponent Na+:H+ antiporter subunit G
MEALELAGSILVLIGSLFLLLSAIGLLRMPDVYNRIQAGTKATTLGTILVLSGIALYHPLWSGKIAVLLLFIILTNPVSSHVLARAAHFIGISLTDETVLDKLKETDREAS